MPVKIEEPLDFFHRKYQIRMSRLAWIILLIIWILLGLWLCHKYLCGQSGLQAAAPPPVAPVVDECDGPWAIGDGNALSISANQFVRFTQSSASHLPGSASLLSGLREAAQYLQSNADRALTITGMYRNGESNNSPFPNLGMARANNVKQWLEELGAPAARIETAARMDNTCWRGDTLRNGVEFAFGAAESADDRLAQIRSRLLGKPITLYFQTNSDNLSFTQQQRQDFADLFYYLDRVDDSTLAVGGHTDSTGDYGTNVALSESRAAFVRDYLVRTGGLTISQMSVDGFGPDQPVASNATDDGRAKNRRVEVTLN